MPVSLSLVVALVHEDVAGVVHPVELHELVHQLEAQKRLGRLMNFLAKRVLPEESRVLLVLGLLLLYDLAD